MRVSSVCADIATPMRSGWDSSWFLAVAVVSVGRRCDPVAGRLDEELLAPEELARYEDMFG